MLIKLMNMETLCFNHHLGLWDIGMMTLDHPASAVVSCARRAF